MAGDCSAVVVAGAIGPQERKAGRQGWRDWQSISSPHVVILTLGFWEVRMRRLVFCLGKASLVVCGVLLAAPSCPGTSALAQTLVALSPEVHFYASPMVLEYTLDEAIRKGVSTTIEIALHSCRGVTIESFSLRRFRISHEDSRHVKTTEKFQHIRMTLTLFNNSGKDKRVGVRFDLMEGDRVSSGPVEIHLDLEQGDMVTKEVDMPLLFEITEHEAVTPTPRLRITLSATDY